MLLIIFNRIELKLDYLKRKKKNTYKKEKVKDIFIETSNITFITTILIVNF